MEDIKQTLWVIVKTMCECESKIPEHCTKFNAIYSIVSFAVAQERERITKIVKPLLVKVYVGDVVLETINLINND